MFRGWVSVIAAAVALALAPAGVASAADVTLATGTFAKGSHRNGVGSLPEPFVVYRLAPFAATDAVETVISGRVPRARVWAFSIYTTPVTPIDVITDKAVRIGRDGRFRITIRRTCGAAHNCLDAAKAPDVATSSYGWLTYRVYDPVDLMGVGSGGVPVPALTYVGRGPAAALDVSRLALPTESPAIDRFLSDAVDAVRLLAARNGAFPAKVAVPDNDPPPTVTTFKDTKDAWLRWLGEQGLPTEPIRRAAANASIGLLDMQFKGVNRYVGTTFDLRRGNFEVRFRAPTYRWTPWDGHAANTLGRTHGAEQLRYWSMCTYKADLQDSACMHDSQFRIGRDRQLVAVVAPRCPVAGYANCLATGSQTRPDFAVVIRNTLPARSFVKRELAGRYAPQARYVARTG